MDYSNENENRETEKRGIWVLPYAWELYCTDERCFRKMLLVSMVDVFSNPVKFREGKIPNGVEMVENVAVLLKRLRCSRATLSRIIENLKSHPSEIFDAAKIDHHTYRLWTRPRPGETAKMLLPAEMLADYERKQLSGAAIVLFAVIVALKKYHIRNDELAKLLHCGRSHIKALLKELEDAEYIERETKCHAGNSTRRIILTEKGKRNATQKSQTHLGIRDRHVGAVSGSLRPDAMEYQSGIGGADADVRGTDGDRDEPTGVGRVPERGGDGVKSAVATGAKLCVAAWHVASAEKLFKTLTEISHVELKHKACPAKWAEPFAELAEKHSQKAIQRELDWYCEHIGEEWVPMAHCAKTFKSKFAKIVYQRLIWERKNGIEPEEDEPMEKIKVTVVKCDKPMTAEERRAWMDAMQ